MPILDPVALPRTAAYVAALPAGVASYPSCRVRTVVASVIAQRFPQVLTHPGLDPTFAQNLRETIAHQQWMSDAASVAARLLVRDVALATDEEYEQWTFDVAKELFAQPFYRALMYVVSPSLVLLGAQRRWASFREGTTLAAKADKNRAEITLTFPERLYPEIVLRGYGAAFRASLVAARARSVELDLTEVTDTRARWDLTWA